jgi:hypothetical protein
LFDNGKGVHVSANEQTWSRHCSRQFRNYARPSDSLLWTQAQLAELSSDQRGGPDGVEAEFGMSVNIATQVDHPRFRAFHAPLEKGANGIGTVQWRRHGDRSRAH